MGAHSRLLVRARPAGLLLYLSALALACAALKLGGTRPASAQAITEFPLPMPGSRPLGITAGPDGALWFAEYRGQQIATATSTATVMATASPTATTTVPDAFEPDDSPAQARPLRLDGGLQQHSFHTPGHNDWVSFSLSAGEQVRLLTGGSPCDTFLALRSRWQDHPRGGPRQRPESNVPHSTHRFGIRYASGPGAALRSGTGYLRELWPGWHHCSRGYQPDAYRCGHPDPHGRSTGHRWRLLSRGTAGPAGCPGDLGPPVRDAGYPVGGRLPGRVHYPLKPGPGVSTLGPPATSGLTVGRRLN